MKQAFRHDFLNSSVLSGRGKWNQAFMAQELRLQPVAFWHHLPSFRGPLSPSLPSSRLIQQSGALEVDLNESVEGILPG